jgi:uncharacterized protein (DUF2461 family)
MSFDGFPKQTVDFLAGVRDHNNKKWFDGHRGDYEQAFLAPAVAFSEALAPWLRKIEPEICVEPRVNGSIMRINRDIRFSKDKSPYKDHLDLWFWTGDRKGWAAVLDARKGEALAAVVTKIRKDGYEVGTESYKRTPPGVAADHPRAALLRHGGLHAGWERKHPAELRRRSFVDFVAGHFSAVAPLHRWLRAM